MVEYWDNSNAPLSISPSISFIAWRANEKSLTSSSGRFFSPTPGDDRFHFRVGHGAVA
jgi:hypothetical protein